MATTPARTRRKASQPSRRLRPMRSTDGFREFVIEQLSAVRELVPKAMFGGMGFYCGDVFFGLIARDALYLKVDDSNRARFEEAGMAPFKPYADRPMTMSYWEVPVHILEDADALLAWARASIAAASVAPVKTGPGRKRGV